MPNQPSNTQSQQSPLVSFVITYYNQPVKLLKECIDSILALSLRPYEREVIIIDDGSDASPMNELLPYSNDITYLRQRNQGPGIARNTGIRLARGQYLQFVDGDDLLNQAAYEHCLDIVRYTKPDMVLFDKSDRPTHGATFNDTEPISGTEYMRNNNLRGSVWGYIFLRSMLGTLRFSTLIYREDEEFTPQLILHANRLVATDAKAYVYRRNRASITHKKGKRAKVKMLSDNLAAIRNLKAVATSLPTHEQTALQRRIDQLTMDYIYQVIILTRSRHYLDRKLSVLRREGLFPLPDKNYTSKYKWFRRLTNSDFGLKLLVRLLPLMKKER